MTVREGPIERPELEQYSETPMFNTKAVVQQTGVPAPTLRAWERRYTLLTPERAGNDYRLYSERDIRMIRWLKERVDAGMTISQAIALFRYKEAESSTQEKPETSSQANLLDAGPDNPSTFQITIEPNEWEQPLSTNLLENEQDQPYMCNWPKLDASYTQSSYPITYDMLVVRNRLLEAFNLLDESMAHLIMGSMLAIYSVEQVCSELIAPTMWRIGQLWADGQLTVSIEHFASNFFRALLTNLLHVTPSPSSGPMAIVCCAPGEPHELAPLMLSLFLRRSGLRVAYLGQSIEIAGLMQTLRKLTPDLLCVSLTMPAYLSGVIDLGRQVAEMPLPRPIFAFGGQVFAQYANIIPQIPGVYMSGDLQATVSQLHNMITEQRFENKN